jgi:hypothetical protein
MLLLPRQGRQDQESVLIARETKITSTMSMRLE